MAWLSYPLSSFAAPSRGIHFSRIYLSGWWRRQQQQHQRRPFRQLTHSYTRIQIAFSLLSYTETYYSLRTGFFAQCRTWVYMAKHFAAAFCAVKAIYLQMIIILQLLYYLFSRLYIQDMHFHSGSFFVSEISSLAFCILCDCESARKAETVFGKRLFSPLLFKIAVSI